MARDESTAPPAANAPGAAAFLRAHPDFAACAALALILTLAVAPSLRGFSWICHEEFHPHVRVRELCRMWEAQGPFHAPWLPVPAFGYGWPFFTYYAPLGYYAAAIAHLWLGFSLGFAVKSSFYLSFYLASFLIYGLVRRFAREANARRPQAWGLAAGVIYALAPYHLCDIFARGSLAESWAWAAMPGLILALEIARARPFAGLLTVAFASWALTLSHNISALYGMTFAALYVLLAIRDLRWPLIAGAGVALGLAMAAYFWYPALKLKPAVLAGEAWRLSALPDALRHHALDWPQFFYERHGTEGSVAGRDDRLGIHPGVVVMASLIAALAAWLARPGKLSDRRLPAALLLACAALFASSRQMPWEWTPELFRYVQFPWRLLIFVVFFACAALGLAAKHIERFMHPFVPLAAAIALGAFGLSGDLVRPYREPERSGWMDRWYATKEDAGMPLGCGAAEYLPVGINPQFIDAEYNRANPAPRTRLSVMRGEIEVLRYRREGASYLYGYRAGPRARARIHVFSFPGWVGLIDGKTRIPLAHDGEGLVAADLPSGEHTFELRYELSPAASAGMIGSYIGWALWFALAARCAAAWAARRKRGIAPGAPPSP